MFLNNKKKILIIFSSFRIGGTTSAGINLINSLVNEGHNVEVFFHKYCGSELNKFQNCTILPKSLYLTDPRFEKSIIHFFVGFLFYSLRIFFSFFRCDFSKILYKLTANRLSQRNYSTVIAYQEGNVTYLSSWIKCENRIAWIHCDYSKYLKQSNLHKENTVYNKYRKIVCVSEYTKNVFVKIFPNKAEKVVAIHNFLEIDEIIKQSFENNSIAQDSEKSFNILSLGRIDPIKRFSKIPSIAAKLKDADIDFKWYIIGGGNFSKEINLIRENIIKYSVQNCVYFLGPQSNPFPYMRSSKLLVVLSESEACPTIINEAKILKVPIVSTNFGSACEMIKSSYGIIVNDIEDIYEELLKIITNPYVYESMKNEFNTVHLDNDSILKQIISII